MYFLEGGAWHGEGGRGGGGGGEGGRKNFLPIYPDFFSNYP